MTKKRPLLEVLRESPSGRKRKEVVRILAAAGLDSREGKRHTVFFHPQHSDVQIAVPRHRQVRAYLVRQAVCLVDLVNEREEDDGTST